MMVPNRALWGALAAALCAALISNPARATVIQYGDQDVLGFGSYPSDPTAGATLEGLATGAVTFGAAPVGHGFPFSPSAGDFPGTDQIYAGSNQTSADDGYASTPLRLQGPQILNLDYSSLVPSGQIVDSLTLGLAVDDFQYQTFFRPYFATINGHSDVDLTNLLNSLNETGPSVRFVSIGINPLELLPSNALALSIDQGSSGGDGWALDFVTVGVTTVPAPVPEPGTFGLLAVAALGGLTVARRRS